MNAEIESLSPDSTGQSRVRGTAGCEAVQAVFCVRIELGQE